MCCCLHLVTWQKQSTAWMETNYSKRAHFRWKIKWRMEHLGALEIREIKQTRGNASVGRQEKYLFVKLSRILLSIPLLWLPCMFLFSLKFGWLQRLLIETMDVSFWNVDHVLKTAWKLSSRNCSISTLFWSLIWEQDGTNVSFNSYIHVRFLSCVISVIVLPTFSSPSSAVFA